MEHPISKPSTRRGCGDGLAELGAMPDSSGPDEVEERPPKVPLPSVVKNSLLRQRERANRYRLG